MDMASSERPDAINLLLYVREIKDRIAQLEEAKTTLEKMIEGLKGNLEVLEQKVNVFLPEEK